MGAERSQWQFPANEVGKVIGWSDEASPSNPNASKGLVNKGPFVEPGDIANMVETTDTDASGFGFVNSTGPLANSSTTLAVESVVKAYVDTGPSTAALQATLRNVLDTAPYVATRTALKALDTTKDTVAYLTESGREGSFVWRTGDFSAEVAADTLEGIYIAPASDSDGSSGAWVRQYDGPVSPFWFGVVGDGVADDTATLQGAITNSSVLLIPRNTEILVTDVVDLHADFTLCGGGKITAGPVAGFTSGAFSSALGMLYSEAMDNITIDGVELDTSAWTTLGAGYASMRCIVMRRGDNLRVVNNKFSTTGGAIGLVGCTDFEVSNNDIRCTQPGVEASGFSDGVIDAWTEFNIHLDRAVIANNRIQCGGWGRWGIMLTGLEFAAVDMNVRSAVIADNIITNCFYDGVWVFGRDAILDGVTVTGNVIDTARKGVAISDAKNFIVSNNVVNNATEQCIHLFSEFAVGVQNACTDGIVANNKLHTTADSVGSSGIWLELGSTRNLIEGNNISGSDYDYGILFDANSIGNRVVGNVVAGAVVQKIQQLALGNRIDGMSYTGTTQSVNNVTSSFLAAAHFYATDEYVIVHFRASVTPTTTGVSTTIRLPLPVASAIPVASGEVLFGSGVRDTSPPAVVTVVGEDAGDAALVTFLALGTTAQAISGSFSYRIIV